MIDQSVPPPTSKAGLTLEEALALPRTLAASVESRFIDANGHMNVSWYVHLFGRATGALFEQMGIDEDQRAQANTGMFAAEQHLRYLAELRQGDPLEVHSQVLEARPKSVRLLHVMTDPARGRISAIAEVVGVHIDFATRRAVPFPADLLARLQGSIKVASPPVFDDDRAQRFARDWVDAWNRRDLDAVLAPYAEDAVFVSPKAEAVVGKARVEGKAELRRYWETASAGIGTLRFTLERALWSPSSQTLTIVYLTAIDQHPPRRAVEMVRFNGAHIVAGEALYGATVDGNGEQQ